MKISHLTHRHGGKITDLFSIEHSTFEKRAGWELIGRVEWQDGTISERAHIAPVCLCADQRNMAAQDEAAQVFRLIDAYLQKMGKWSKDFSRWIPKAKSGQLAI